MSNKLKKEEISRRKFIEGIGLTVGAAMLNPITSLLYSEAMAQTTLAKQKVIIVLQGESWPLNCYPKEFQNMSPSGTSLFAKTGIPLTKNFTWPTSLASLAPYRNNALLVDGFYLHNLGGGIHTTGFRPLSDGSSTDDPSSLPPESITIDQHLARGAVGAGTPIPSVLFGMSQDFDKSVGYASSFASGKNAPITHIIRAQTLSTKIFGTNVAATGTPAPAPAGNASRASILDFLRQDIKKLQARLTSAEKDKLDDYLHSIDTFDKKQVLSSSLNCSGGNFITAKQQPGKELEEMVKMATFAMKCGMTNVAAFSVGNDNTDHGTLPAFEFFNPLGNNNHSNHPHDPTRYTSTWHTGMMEYMTRMIGNMLTGLSGKAGVMPDNTTVLYMPSNGISQGGWHHGLGNRVPALILSSNPAFIKGGNFVQYKRDTYSIGALHLTLSHALGMPISSFGAYSGPPIRQLLA